MHAIVMLLIQVLPPSPATVPSTHAPVPLGADPCAAAAPAAPATAASPGEGTRSRFVRLPDGVRMRVVEAGPEDGEPLIVLHGYSDSWFSFSPVLPLLADRYRIIAPDLRGHGCSDRPAGGYGMDVLADDAVRVMDALGVQRAAVLGHSMGGFVAQQVAARHPQRVERLVLVGTALRFAGTAVAEGLAGVVDALPDPVPVDFVRDFQGSTFHRPLPEAFVAAVVAESMKLPAPVWRALMAGMLAMEPVAPALAAVGSPTLLLWGELDAVFGPPDRDELRRALPHATAVEYAETGHAPHWESPERFAADLRAFLAGARMVRP